MKGLLRDIIATLRIDTYRHRVFSVRRTQAERLVHFIPEGCTITHRYISKGTKPDLEAYSDPYGWYSKITFCNYFFNGMKSLSEVMSNAKKGKPGSTDLWNYQNRARVMFHEVLHLSYFMNAPAKSPIIDDVVYDTKKVKNIACYGPENVKILANYEAVDIGGFFPQRNADSYAWFAMAKYVESHINK